MTNLASVFKSLALSGSLVGRLAARRDKVGARFETRCFDKRSPLGAVASCRWSEADARCRVCKLVRQDLESNFWR
jgi:hypothetical protein